ncbi:MAG: hypothetical protein RQ714_09050 [Nitrosomonas sp.]|nr:hypothetical protein [Nitrosomonas sp.]
MSQAALNIYRDWLLRNRVQWLKRGRLPPLLSERYERLSQKIAFKVASALRKIPYLWRLAPPNHLDRPSRLRRYVFAWAVNEVSGRYRKFYTESD